MGAPVRKLTRSHMIPMQDAHEFLNYLLNECSELLEKEAKEKAGVISHSNGTVEPTWIHDLFQARAEPALSK